MGGTIVYGEEGAEPLLCVTALGSGSFEVDPRNQELKRLPAILLKSCDFSSPGKWRAAGEGRRRGQATSCVN